MLVADIYALLSDDVQRSQKKNFFASFRIESKDNTREFLGDFVRCEGGIRCIGD